MCCSSRAVTSFTQECVAKSWLLPDKEKAAGLCARFFAAVFAAPSNIMWLQNAMAHAALLQVGCMGAGQNLRPRRT